MGRYNPVCILNHQGQLGLKWNQTRQCQKEGFELSSSARIIPKSELVGHFGEGSLRITTFWWNSQLVPKKIAGLPVIPSNPLYPLGRL